MVDSILDHMSHWKVNDFVDQRGYWKMEILKDILPESWVRKIMALMPPSSNEDSDRRI